MENGVPNHLKPYFVITQKPKALNGEFAVRGSIKCPCGSETFTIIRDKYEVSPEYKEAQKRIETFYEKYRKEFPRSKGGRLIETGSEDGKWCIAHETYAGGHKVQFLEDITELRNIMCRGPFVPTFFEAVCTQCGQKILVFDSRQHGYDSMAMAGKINYFKDFKTMKKQKCRKCGSESSKATIKISNTGKDDLFAESSDLINDDNWENAFDWITIDLECVGCGKQTKKYLNMETM